jgi:hypothetical protein
VIETDQQQANHRCYQHRSWAPGKLTPSLQDWQKYQKIPNSLENAKRITDNITTLPDQLNSTVTDAGIEPAIS